MTRVALLLLTLSLVLPASIQTPPSRNTIKIGAFLSLTGATAEYGISASNAIKLATDVVNRNVICSAEVEAIAKFAVNKLKAKTAAVFLDERNDYAVVC